jgi:hypothetical protein
MIYEAFTNDSFIESSRGAFATDDALSELGAQCNGV